MKMKIEHDIIVVLLCIIGCLVVMMLTGCSTVYKQRGDDCLNYAVAKAIQMDTGCKMTHAEVKAFEPRKHLGRMVVGTDALRQAEMPVICIIPLYDGNPEFEMYGVYRQRGGFAGNHAMLCVGWKDGRFEFANSWGGTWGVGGHCFISDEKIPAVFGWEYNDIVESEETRRKI